MQRCSLYLRKGTFFVVSHFFNPPYAEFLGGPMFKVAPLTPSEVGEAVIAALDASKEGIKPPDDIESLNRRLYDFLGVKRWSDVLRKTTYAVAQRQSDTITITGYQAGGHWFVADGTTITTASANAEEVGRAVIKRLTVSGVV